MYNIITPHVNNQTPAQMSNAQNTTGTRTDTIPNITPARKLEHNNRHHTIKHITPQPSTPIKHAGSDS